MSSVQILFRLILEISFVFLFVMHNITILFIYLIFFSTEKKRSVLVHRCYGTHHQVIGVGKVRT